MSISQLLLILIALCIQLGNYSWQKALGVVSAREPTKIQLGLREQALDGVYVSVVGELDTR